MILESLDQVNIKDLTFEVPKPELNLDIPKVAKDWLRTETKYPLRLLLSDIPDENCELALCAKILIPEDFDDCILTETELVESKEKIDSFGLQARTHPYWPAQACLKAALGQRVDQVVNEDIFDKARRAAAFTVQGGSPASSSRLLAYAILIASQRGSEITIEERNELKDGSLQEVRRTSEVATLSGYSGSRLFLRAVLVLKTFYPQENFRSVIDQETIDGLKDFIWDPKNEPERTIKVAAALALLVADEVQITTEGLTVVRKETIADFGTTFQLPVRRAF